MALFDSISFTSPASRTYGASVALFYSYLVPISPASRTSGASVAYLILIVPISPASRTYGASVAL